MSTAFERYLEGSSEVNYPTWYYQDGFYNCWWKNSWWSLEYTDDLEDGKIVWLLCGPDNSVRKVRTNGGAYAAMDIASEVINKISS